MNNYTREASQHHLPHFIGAEDTRKARRENKSLGGSLAKLILAGTIVSWGCYHVLNLVEERVPFSYSAK